MPRCLGFLVRQHAVKSVKNELEKRSLYNKRVKIYKHTQLGAMKDEEQALFVIPTKLPVDDPLLFELRSEFTDENPMKSSCASNDCDWFNLIVDTVPIEVYTEEITPATNPLHAAFANAIVELELNSSLPVKQHVLRHVLPRSYNIYPPLLLLPITFSTANLWANLLDPNDQTDESKLSILQGVAKALGVTHIAVDAPIPALGPGSGVNHLRSPTNLQPLLGDFGPELPPFPDHIPAESDFSDALWVSARQNGITQVWAPRYTMFSSGNVTEKARILNLGSVAASVRQGNDTGPGCTAVDLFSGIGYFAFSYIKAGVSKVLCWDLNPWSVEGLRRGALANRWTVRIIDESTELIADEKEMEERLLVFNESNANALAKLKVLRSRIPPVRHVNCGMLPTANPMWRTAVDAIDPVLGGCIHLHETVRTDQVEARARDILSRVCDHWLELHVACTIQPSNTPVLEYIEKVKSVGPRLLHIVLDIYIPGAPS